MLLFLLRFAVRLGEHTISTDQDCDFADDPDTCNTDEPPLQDIEIEKVIPNDNFDEHQRTSDIALLKLQREVLLKNIRGVETICLPVRPQQNIENLPKDKNNKLVMTIAGWGRTETSKKSDVLLQAFIPYIEQIQCAVEFRNLNVFKSIQIHETHLVKQTYFMNI